VDLGNDYDLIIHASAVLGIQKVADEPLHTLDTNILGTKCVLEFAARQKNLQKFVFFSTSEVYGQEANQKDEASSFVIANDSPRWCYAASKVTGEFYVQAYGNQYGFETAIVRPFNVYGPYRYGSNAMTKLVAKALKGEDIIISGNGSQSRSWCYIDDFVEGVLASCMQSREKHAVFNIGNDRDFLTMRDFAEKLIKLSGSSSRILVEGKSGADVQVRRPDLEKARRLLGYNPSVDLETGMTRVIQWAAQANRPLH
jgi:nucleoside-diphosphate-sugar epimerase